MLFTCPGAAARGGHSGATRGGRRHVCIDVHCHVHYPPADEMVKHVFARDREPALRFSNALSRATNQKQADNVRVCLTSVEQRLRDMDKMGVDVQAISCSPFQNLWGADHIVVGTDYPYDMGWYDPRGFVDGCDFLTEADKAKIEGLNAAKLLKITSRLTSMGPPAAKAGSARRPALKTRARK